MLRAEVTSRQVVQFPTMLRPRPGTSLRIGHACGRLDITLARPRHRRRAGVTGPVETVALLQRMIEGLAG